MNWEWLDHPDNTIPLGVALRVAFWRMFMSYNWIWVSTEFCRNYDSPARDEAYDYAGNQIHGISVMDQVAKRLHLKGGHSNWWLNGFAVPDWTARFIMKLVGSPYAW